MIVRVAGTDDAPALTALVNQIIAIGGTTAYEEPFTVQGFVAHYLDATQPGICHLAEAEGQVLGYQVLGPWPGLPVDWLDIGTFVAPRARGTGAAGALFQASLGFARAQGCPTINATIRADNRLGLGYYQRMGFVDYATEPEFRLKNGTQVGRILKRYDL